MNKSSNSYDIIIIGAGISGLVCGCYLAKAGMKVLICEQHYKPGGYCSSFKRKGVTFDAAAHCFGGYRKDGITRKVFKDLEIDKKINIIRSNPTGIVITPDNNVSFWTALDKTVKDFQKAFPDEKNNIKKFFNFIMKPDSKSFTQIRRYTFKDLLDKYFTNDKLKFTLSAPLLGIGGLPSSLMSAFIGAKLYSEFLLDGGYRPEDGMQEIPKALNMSFNEYGGELRLSCLVRKIKVKDNNVIGVLLENGEFIPSNIIISNCDARQTFLNLLGKEKLSTDFHSKIKKMMPSLSNFILYLRIDKHLQSLPQPGCTLCFFPHYNLNIAYKAALKGDIETFGGFMIYIYKYMPIILATIPTSYKNKKYWVTQKDTFMNIFINRIEQYLIPKLSNHIIYKESATPYTSYRYTLNFQGASFGWAGTPLQLAISDFKKPSFINGLYLTGHWTTFGFGISSVIYIGHEIAKLLKKNFLRYKI